MSFDMVSSVLSAYNTAKTSSYTASANTTDTSSVASKLTTRLLKNRNAAKTGFLKSSDVTELSADDFKKLDANGDKKLSSDEITKAFTDHMDSIKLAMQAGGSGSRSTISALKNTAAGKLMKALNKMASPVTSTPAATTKTATTTKLDVKV